MTMKTAFVFPGQGAQSVGMMAAYAGLPEIEATFQEASAALDKDLWALTADGPAEALNQTINTQPVMLTASVAIYRAWLAAGGQRPEVVAGHSLGEYAALVAAGALSFIDAVKAVQYRAQLMQQAVPSGGAMAAVLGLDAMRLSEICQQAAEETGQVVELVNFNAPGQIVIAGHLAAVEKVAVLAKPAGAKRVAMLAVSGPFHSSLMAPAAEKMADYLQTVPVQTPEIPVLHNVDSAPHAEPDAIRRILSEQIRCPVQWINTVGRFEAMGIARIIESGPGKVLTGLDKRIAPGLMHVVLSDKQAILELTAKEGANHES